MADRASADIDLSLLTVGSKEQKIIFTLFFNFMGQSGWANNGERSVHVCQTETKETKF